MTLFALGFSEEPFEKEDWDKIRTGCTHGEKSYLYKFDAAFYTREEGLEALEGYETEVVISEYDNDPEGRKVVVVSEVILDEYNFTEVPDMSAEEKRMNRDNIFNLFQQWMSDTKNIILESSTFSNLPQLPMPLEDVGTLQEDSDGWKLVLTKS